MFDSILISIFISLPEAILMLLIGLSLCNIRTNIKKIALIALIQAFIAFALKIFHVPFGANSIIQIVSLWILVTVILHIRFYKAVVPVLTGTFIDNIIQQILISVGNLFIKFDFSKLSLEFLYTFIYSIFLFIFMIIILIIIKKRHFVFCDLSLEGESVGE